MILSVFIEIYTCTVHCGVVGNHRAKHQTCIFDENATAIFNGTIIINQTADHTTALCISTTCISTITIGINATAITFCCIFCNDAVLQYSIQPHIHTTALVSSKIGKTFTTVGSTTLDSDTVKHGSIFEFNFARHRSKPNHVACTGNHIPLTAILDPFGRFIVIIGTQKKGFI